MGGYENFPVWRKSTFSQNGDCAQWMPTETAVYLRHSKDPSGPVLEFTPAEWRAFVDGVKSGEADLTTAG
jgi:Domain of unknown function (DUF397)